MSGSFADSNVLLYLPDKNPAKADIAEKVLGQGLTISVQVLNEIALVMLRKWRRSWDEIESFLAEIRDVTTVLALDEETHELGLKIAREHQLRIYDSMVVASALLARCDVLYSEDMQDGMIFRRRLTIINPFAAH